MLMQEIGYTFNSCFDIMKRYGTPNLATNEYVQWDAVNSETKQTKTVSLPKMMVGSTWLGKITSADQKVPIVDKIPELHNGVASVFQKMNDAGDMIRVATSVSTNGQRALGTYIPSINSDGTPNAVVSRLLNGESYTGKAWVVDDWYIAKYEPLKDASGKVIGAIAIAKKMESAKSLRQAIMKTLVGKTGYVYILGSRGDEKGKYIISKNGESDGKLIWETKDDSGRLFIQDIINKAIDLKPDEIAYDIYPWRNEGETEARTKIVGIKYFEPWGWVIGAGAYEDDFYATRDVLLGAINSTILWSVVFGVILMIGMIVVALIISSRIANPVKELTEAANKIKDGNLNVSIDVKSKDEIGQLAGAFSVVIETLNNLIGTTDTLIEAAAEGKLDVRGKSDNYQGAFKTLVDGFNQTMDNIIKPLNVTAEYVDRISKGDMPPKITDDYKGDFIEIKNNLNLLIDSLNNFVGGMDDMAKNQAAGEIDFNIDANNFSGVYKQMTEGFNNTVNEINQAILKILDVITSYAEGNFDIVLEKMEGKRAVANEKMDLIRNNLINVNGEINKLIDSSEQGHLSVRADAEGFMGAYADMVNGLNKTLDLILDPINEAVKTLQQMAAGNLSVEMKGDYNGDHNLLKDSINETIRLMPFRQAIATLESIADGDLTRDMDGDFKGDSQRLQNALNETISSMNEILSQVMATVDEVNRGAIQVSDASTSLSQGATEQAASLEEITSSMSEIGSQTRHNAENASLAKTLTDESRDSSEKGNAEMENLNKAMSEISESSMNISKIIKVIDEIAFQTNLLALNAAVEAARAGRHGKGFAVVAEEVRNLAARSATAAKETAELIEGSIKVVENGSMLANRTSEVLKEITNSSIKSADIVGEIANLSNEQAQAIAQINEGLTQIDKVTQTNTASAEQSASASEELSGQANNLKGMISKFSLKAGNYSLSGQSYGGGAMINSGRDNKRLPESFDDEIETSPDDVINLDDDDFGKY